ncbi:MAG: SUMF1/EgtB/PvdO family nonheme iron enzyme [Solirubrobacterales bacterium]
MKVTRTQAALLLYFVLHRNSVVSVDVLHERFWRGKDVSNVHTAALALRRALEPEHRREYEVLVSELDGYKLVLADEDLDACRFEALVAQARKAAEKDPASARKDLRAALSLWRGDAYHEARTHGFAEDEIRRLESLRDSARELLFELEVDCGNAPEVIAEIESFYSEPSRADWEPRVKLRAYLAMEQPAKAAEVYETFCEEHEQEPSVEFTELYTNLLSQLPTAKPAMTFSEAVGRSAVAKYREWVQEQLRHSDIRWVVGAPQSGVSLNAAELFTPLYVDSGPAQVATNLGTLSLEELVERSARILLLGDSGCGKSTFLEHLGRVAAADGEGAVPVLIRCRELVEGAWASEKEPGWRSLRKEIEDKLERESPGLRIDELERLASAGGVIWLVDALNEVPKTEERAKLADMLSSAAQHWPHCKWVVTSSSTLTADFLPLGFEVAQVAEWDPEHMREFLRSLVRLSLPGIDETDVNARAEVILGRVLDHPDPVMRRLGGTPLFLTAMAVLDLAGRPPAESRADLLESIISWLEEDRMGALQQALGNSPRVDEVLSALAYYMVSAEGGVAAQVGRLAAAKAIEHLFSNSREAALAFVSQASTIGGLILPKGVGDIGFSQDLFRDYLAAKHLAGRTDELEDEGWWHALEPHLDDPAWRDVLSFVPARLLHLGRERVDLFFGRFGETTRSTPFETRTRRVAVGGQILRDLRPLGYTSASHIPAWHEAVTGVRQLFEVASDEPDLQTKFEAAVAYGREGDPRLQDPKSTWSWLPGGSCTVGAQATDPSAPGFDRDAAPWEGPVREVQLERFAIRKFPITVVEYGEFVEDGGYETLAADLWSSEGWSWKTSLGVAAPLDWADQQTLPNAPVTGISWFEAMAFAAWLSERESSSKLCCRLPSEAQWEFAARQDVPPSQQFPWGNRMTLGSGAEANWAGCFLRHKSPVGMFQRSTTRAGVADLFGNVEEWCRDRWDSAAPPEWRSDPSSSLDHRVVRGGSTIRFSRLCRPSYRSRILAGNRYHTVGFRPVLERVAR